ncbi:anaphase-promoting complex subunit 3 [Rhizoctonia solani AG-3 Rhs1AP]|uniref:Anaphase-promoting complex subunit 3 n=1 Tax=Rhizoctonia solani AG-3 Rhs1AP TaxID=1086054 RepID=X8JFR0_9AGAM|nr:anaphase-promoting complex subunit 3 [Rhizoctonia solani AG-3 Rhs1AP]
MNGTWQPRSRFGVHTPSTPTEPLGAFEQQGNYQSQQPPPRNHRAHHIHHHAAPPPPQPHLQTAPSTIGPAPPSATTRLEQLVKHSLEHDLARTAVFYAERLHSLTKGSHDARHLLSKALLAAGQINSALGAVSGTDMCWACCQLYARCSERLRKYRIAREMMERCLKLVADVGHANGVGPLEEATMHCQAGQYAMKGNLHDKAVASLKEALRLNPYLWEAFEMLGALGSFPDPSDVFPSKRPRTSESQGPQHIAPSASGAGFFTPPAASASNAAAVARVFGGGVSGFRIEGPRDSMTSNDSSIYPDNSMNAYGGAPTRLEGRPAVKRQRGRPGAASATSLAEMGEKKKVASTKMTTRSASENTTNTISGVARRSTRLLSGLGKGIPSKVGVTRERKRSAPKRTGSDMDEESNPTTVLPPPPASPTPSSPGRAEAEAADAYIMDLVRTFARAVQALAQYRSADVLEELESLPEEQKRSASVMVLIGRAEYERADYIKAKRAFTLARTLDPSRIWDMDIFSTLLWHLRNDVELSFLAQELLALDQRSPQAWIAVGNAFSLQKEHEQALTAFKRAVALDPHCAYAHTLIGHESVSMEEFEKAASSFQSALRVDKRHYNAWYGLGTVYQKTSKLRHAEYHFERAAEINPCNAVLQCCLGIVIEKRGEREVALRRYDHACRISPENSLVRFNRARLLMLLARYEEAIEDLVRLKDIVSDEANVWFTLGKAYWATGRRTLATQHLTVAQELDPKLVGAVRELMERGGEEEQGDVGDSTMDESTV